jgi:hypothetical protein
VTPHLSLTRDFDPGSRRQASLLGATLKRSIIFDVTSETELLIFRRKSELRRLLCGLAAGR